MGQNGTTSDKFSLTFSLDAKDGINIDFGDLSHLSEKDLEKVCVLIYSANAGLFYQDILKQLGVEILQHPETSGPLLTLVSALTKMGKRKSVIPLVLPSEVLGKMNG